MDWSKVKSAIGTVAPWIAGTLGTPVAGVAVKAICDLFGLNSSTATPDDVTAALAGATPEQLLALKQADQKHQEFMVQIGYDHLDKLAAIDAGDRDSARKREMTVQDWTPRILAYTIVIAFVVMVAATLGGLSKVDSVLAGTLVGYLSAKCEQVIAYYFGSSRGSDRKTELMAQGAQQ